MKQRIKVMKKHFRKALGKDHKDFDQIVGKDIDHAIINSEHILGIINEDVSKPITLFAPNTTTDRLVKYKLTEVDKERRVDFDYALVTTLFFGAKRLYIHQTSLDIITGTSEYFLATEVAYKDITVVETAFGHVGDKDDISFAKVILGLSNGNEIELLLRVHYLTKDVTTEDLITKKERYILDTLKKAIRETK